MLPLAFVLLLLTACDLAGSEDATVVASASPTVASTASPPAPLETPATSPAETPAATQGITLTVWTTTEIAPNSEVAGGPLLLEQLSAFDNERDNVRLNVELKTISDQGGTLSYLRTGRSVAPDILPDVILLPASELSSAAAQGLIFPLDPAVFEQDIEELFPVARELVEVDDQVYGYPIALTNLRHIVYDSAVITETVSTNWNSLVADSPGTFIFPAAGADGARLTAQFYQEFGGTYVNGNGEPALQTEPLVQTLTLMQQGIANGSIDSQSGNISSLDEAWQLFQAEPRHILQTTAKFYMERLENEGGANLRTSGVPGPNGALAPTVGAWLWAISTPDAARQVTAGELIRWLSDASYVGEWCLQSNAVPARRTAFEVWPANTYVTFLQQQVAQARPAPAGLNNSVLTVLSDATTAVLLGLSTPTESAEQAVTALAP